MAVCIFCKFVRNEVSCHKIFESDNTLAFLDINPYAKGHTIIIPKIHGEIIFDLPEEQIKELMVDVRKVMQRIQEVLNPDGFNVGWNHNTAGGQVVPHLHIHIFPRYNRDGGGSMHSIVNNSGKMSVDEVMSLFRQNFSAALD